jgi:hypothetical protein
MPSNLRDVYTVTRDEQAAIDEVAAGRCTDDVLARLRHPTCVVFLVPLLTSRDAVLLASVERALGHLRARMRPGDWVAVDEAIRAAAYGSWRVAGAPTLATNDVERLGPASLAFAASSRDGYLREAVTRRLVALHDGSELAPLLVRANDWVDPVRHLARQGLLARVRVERVDDWLRDIHLVDRLEIAGRDDHRALRASVAQLLMSRDARGAVERAVASEDRYVARRASAILVESVCADGRDDEIAEAVSLVMQTRDPATLLMLARQVGRLKRGELRARWLAAAKSSPVAVVRRVAWELALVGEHVDDSKLSEALFDVSRSVRDLTQRRARGCGLDPAALYRRALDGARVKSLVAALEGLRETGAQSDAAAIEDLLLSSAPRVRAAAVRALAKLDGEAHTSDFVVLLEDAPRVSRAATEALFARAGSVDLERLRQLVGSTSSPRAAVAALRVANKRTRWSALELVLEAFAAPLASTRGEALEALRKWKSRFARDFSRPTAEEHARLTALVAANEERLGLADARELRAVLATWKSQAR